MEFLNYVNPLRVMGKSELKANPMVWEYSNKSILLYFFENKTHGLHNFQQGIINKKL